MLPGCVSSERERRSAIGGEELISDLHFIHGFHLVDPELRNTDYALWQPCERVSEMKAPSGNWPNGIQENEFPPRRII